MIDVELEIQLPWSKVVDGIGEGVREAVQTAVREGAQEARVVHTYKDRTGDLTRSIRGWVESYNRLGAIGVLQATQRYASWVENGTLPHEIWPKEGHGFTGPLRSGQSRRARNDIGTHRVALRWFDDEGVHFARHVMHRGSRPYPFMGPGMLKAERVLEREIEVAVARAAAELERL